jgi:hypothetical protein
MKKEINLEAVKKALESGDGVALAALSNKGHADRVESINPQIQKVIAATLMSLAKYTVNPKISESISAGGSQLTQLKEILKSKGTLTPEVETILDAQIEAQKKSFAKSDGIQKSWQAWMIDLIAAFFKSIGMPNVAKALLEAQADLVKNGQKRAMNKTEKAAYEKSVAEGTADEDEDEDAAEPEVEATPPVVAAPVPKPAPAPAKPVEKGKKK